MKAATAMGLQKRGMFIIVPALWLLTAAISVVVLSRSGVGAIAIALSIAINLVPTLCLYKQRIDQAARAATGLAAGVQPAVLVFVMQGLSSQIDMHLYFFVALAMLIPLLDKWPIVISCSVIILHHAGLAILAPEWVFFGEVSVLKVAIHGVATLCIGAALCWISGWLCETIASLERQRSTSDEQAKQLRKTKDSLESALREVAKEQEKNARVRKEIIEVRRAEYETVASQFESSISDVTHAVAATATMLERSARSLKTLAASAGQEANDVVNSARSASRSAGIVAKGVSEISVSIASIAARVNEQSGLTAEAQSRTGNGGSAIGTLAERSKTIGETTHTIVRIAERTDLLSLNAAIEAASAGPSGRGFTIVAQEVKVLANQAAHAASQIDDFLTGMRKGTVEAEKSFSAINNVIADLNNAARAISIDVDNQRLSASTIDEYACNAAEEADAMVERTQMLSEKASAARDLSGELEHAAAALAENVRSLERSTEDFMRNLKQAA